MKRTIILQLFATVALTSPSFAEGLKEGDHFEWKWSNEITGKTDSYDEIILQVDPEKIVYRFQGNGQTSFTTNTMDRQLRITESGTFAYEPGNCSGVPSPLEVGKTQKFNLESTFTDIKANTKHVLKMHCTSKVVGKEARDVDGKTFDVFVIQNVAEYNNLANGAPQTYGVSGVFAPKLGYWVEKTVVERQRGVVTNKAKSTLQHFNRQDESQM